MMPRILACIGLVLCMTGCSTTGKQLRFYDGEPRRTNEVAILKVQRNLFGHSALVRSIDERTVQKRWVYNNTKQIELLPGTHSLTVDYVSGDTHSVAPIRLNFSVEAGKTYRLLAAPEERTFGQMIARSMAGGYSRWSAWIVDEQTDQVIAGTRREKPYRWYEH